jgi:hypothetical protein
LDTSYVSALAALAGAAIGGLASFASTFTSQKMQLQNERRKAEAAKLEALYSEFITEAGGLFGDALSHQTEEITSLVRLFSLVGRMRLVADRAVVAAAERVEDKIIETYLGPNRTLHEMMDFAHQGGMQFLVEFSEACRKDLNAR